MAITFEIDFKSSQSSNIYYSGQTLSGDVRLNLEKSKKIRAICIYVTGSGRVSWSSYNLVGEENKIENIEHSGNEDYINCRTCSYGAASGSFFELSAGTHTYTFNYALPIWLPSSFEGTHGYIRYAVDVVLERPWKFDRTFKKPFTVCRTLDLNRDPSLKLPSRLEYKRYFYTSTNARGLLSIVVNLLRSGYAFGEMIPVETEIINNCGFSINRLIFSLRKIIIYTCQYPEVTMKEEMVKIAEKSVDCLIENDRRSFMERLEIPFTPPTSITSCKVVNIVYEIKIEALIPGLGSTPAISIPLTIGTVPFSIDTSSPNLNRPGVYQLDLHGRETMPQYVDCPPPSYESVYGTSSDINN